MIQSRILYDKNYIQIVTFLNEFILIFWWPLRFVEATFLYCSGRLGPFWSGEIGANIIKI